MSRLPIRIRLALFFSLALAAVLFLMGLFVYERVSTDLSSGLDIELRSRAQDLSALVSRGGSLRRTGSPFIEHGETFAEVVGRDRRVLDSTPSLGGQLLLSPAELDRARTGQTFVNRPFVPGLDEPARMLAVPVERGVLVVGATRENRLETLSSLRRAFFIGGPVALVLAAFGGYLLAGATLRPIEAMRRRAAEISTSSLDERLPVPPARDEVARLGETLNEMLSRIEDGVLRERRFVADASHELRTPLTMLRTELELALRRARTPEELEGSIRSAAEETERLSRIADDLLLLARAEQGRLPLKLESIDLVDVLDTVAERFRARAAADGRPIIVDGEPPVARADRLRLEQALGNLVDNALRHGRGPVTISAAAQDSIVELGVTDTGRGFPEEFLGRAFEPFSRAADRGAEGSGLGLAIVETIVRAHEGQVSVANRRDRGADVRIRLPR